MKPLVLLLDIATFLAIYVLITLALHIQYSYAGILNIGLHLQVAGAAFATAVFMRGMISILDIGKGLDFVSGTHFIVRDLNVYFSTHSSQAVIFLLAIVLIAIAFSGLLGWIAIVPALRLTGMYQVIFFLALAEFFVAVGVHYTPLAGGVFGIGVPNFFAWLGEFGRWGYLAFLFSLCIVSVLIAKRFCDSPFGRVLKVIRENELAARALGKDVDKFKVKAMIFSSIFAGLGGVLFAIHIGAIIPPAYNGLDFGLWPLAAVIIGGTGNLMGTIAGVFVLMSIRRIVYVSRSYFTFLPFDVAWFEPIMLGILIWLFITYRPRGIIPERKIVGIN